MVYICKSAEYVSNCQGQKIVFRIVFCIWITSSSIHISTLKQHSMSACRQNKDTHRYLVKAENAISNCENWPSKASLKTQLANHSEPGDLWSLVFNCVSLSLTLVMELSWVGQELIPGLYHQQSWLSFVKSESELLLLLLREF